MTEDDAAHLPRGVAEITFTKADTVRMIATAYIDAPAMAPLADDAAALADLETLEMRTSRRHDGDMPLPSGVRRAELLSEAQGFGWSYINAAFCYTRPDGNRFSGPERGAWYAGWGRDATETVLAEVAWHLGRELANVGIFENTTDYRELIAGFTTRMADLRGCEGCDFLDPDPGVGYPAGQALGREVLRAGIPGIVFPSVRRPGGRCLAALRPGIIQNVRQGASWRLTWDGACEPETIRL